VADIVNQVPTGLRSDIHDRLDGIENVTFQLFYDFEEVMEHDEDVVVTLHENSSSSNQYSYPAFIKGRRSNRSDPEKNPFTTKRYLSRHPQNSDLRTTIFNETGIIAHGAAVESPSINQEFNALGTKVTDPQQRLL